MHLNLEGGLAQAAPAWKKPALSPAEGPVLDEDPSTACFTAVRPIAMVSPLIRLAARSPPGLVPRGPLPPYRAHVRLAPGHGLTRYQYW